MTFAIWVGATDAGSGMTSRPSVMTMPVSVAAVTVRVSLVVIGPPAVFGDARPVRAGVSLSEVAAQQL